LRFFGLAEAEAEAEAVAVAVAVAVAEAEAVAGSRIVTATDCDGDAEIAGAAGVRHFHTAAPPSMLTSASTVAIVKMRRRNRPEDVAIESRFRGGMLPAAGGTLEIVSTIAGGRGVA